MKEEEFWRNYFYRVSIIKQSTNLKQLKSGSISAKGAAAKAGWGSDRSSSGEGPDEPGGESVDVLDTDEPATGDQTTKDSFQTSADQAGADNSTSNATFDFEEEMRKLGIDPSSTTTTTTKDGTY